MFSTAQVEAAPDGGAEHGPHLPETQLCNASGQKGSKLNHAQVEAGSCSQSCSNTTSAPFQDTTLIEEDRASEPMEVDQRTVAYVEPEVMDDVVVPLIDGLAVGCCLPLDGWRCLLLGC